MPTSIKNSPLHPVYLWLNCEGWVRFGPFRSLRLEPREETGEQQFIDSRGKVIAYEDRLNHCWRSTDPEFLGNNGSGWAFRTPLVSGSRKRPHL